MEQIIIMSTSDKAAKHTIGISYNSVKKVNSLPPERG